jgi:acyl carrier protein
MTIDPQQLIAIRDAVNRHLKRRPKTFDDETAIVSSGLIDSMSIVDLILDLESALGVKIPASDVQPDDFDSVRTIARTVSRFL